MDAVTKTGDNSSQHHTEDVEKHNIQHVKGADAAADLIGNQQIELTDEDVSNNH
jgi:hypothetical protein